MMEWLSNDDIIFHKNTIFTTFLKSFHGAPLFTTDELKILEDCFHKIGIVKVGKYPSKKDLKTNETIFKFNIPNTRHFYTCNCFE